MPKKDVKKAPATKDTAAKDAPKPAKSSAKVAVKGAADVGSTVSVSYRGTFTDGSVFDSSEGRDPLVFTVGQHQVIPGFENAVKGMKAGEKKTFTVPAKEAYGDRNPALIHKVPLETLKASGITPEKGLVLGLTHPQQPGMQIPAVIVDVDEKAASIDLNHPLAGKDLTFEIELVKVE